MAFDLCGIGQTAFTEPSKLSPIPNTLEILFLMLILPCTIPHSLPTARNQFVAIFAENLSSMRKGVVLRSVLAPGNLGNDIGIESSRCEGKNTEYLSQPVKMIYCHTGSWF